MDRRKEVQLHLLCSVHAMVNATHDRESRETVNDADLARPDGAPIVWAMRCVACGRPALRSDLMLAYLPEAAVCFMEGWSP